MFINIFTRFLQRLFRRCRNQDFHQFYNLFRHRDKTFPKPSPGNALTMLLERFSGFRLKKLKLNLLYKVSATAFDVAKSKLPSVYKVFVIAETRFQNLLQVMLFQSFWIAFFGFWIKRSRMPFVSQVTCNPFATLQKTYFPLVL